MPGTAAVEAAVARSSGAMESIYFYPIKGLSPQRVEHVELSPGQALPGTGATRLRAGKGHTARGYGRQSRSRSTSCWPEMLGWPD
jgi:hypothetical protein